MHNAQLVRSATLALLLFLLPSLAHGQEAVVITAAPIFLKPDGRRTPLRTAAANSRLRVIEEQPDGWVEVEFRDPQFGMRIGFIEARHIRVTREELVPLDLSVGKEPERAPAARPATVQPSRSNPPVAPSHRFARGWIDVNLGVAMAGDSRYQAVYEPVLFGQTATVSADYRSPRGAEFDFGGGFMFTPVFGLGLSFAGTAHQDNAQLGIEIPHPFFDNAHASDSVPTDGKLMRTESSVNIQAMFVSSPSDRVSLRFFGGPSYFRIRQDAVGIVRYDQAFLFFSPGNAVEITGYDASVIDFEDNGGWGFHVGGDASFFFNRVVGLGWFAKYTQGTVGVFDPLSGEDWDLKTGGFQTGGGLRLRF